MEHPDTKKPQAQGIIAGINATLYIRRTFITRQIGCI